MDRDTEIDYCCGVCEYKFLNCTEHFQVRFYVLAINLCFKQNKI